MLAFNFGERTSVRVSLSVDESRTQPLTGYGMVFDTQSVNRAQFKKEVHSAIPICNNFRVMRNKY